MQKNKLVIWLQSHRIMLISITLCLLIAISVAIILSKKDTSTSLAAKELETLSQNIRKHYQNRPDFWGLSSDVVINKKIAPTTMISNNELVGILGNKILIGNGINAYVLMPGARGFDIVYKNLNKKDCINLASFNFEKQFWLELTSVNIAQKNKSIVFSWDDNQRKLPITKAAAKKACANAASIIWHFE